jgi:hypothetical protein
MGKGNPTQRQRREKNSTQRRKGKTYNLKNILFRDYALSFLSPCHLQSSIFNLPFFDLALKFTGLALKKLVSLSR